MGGGCARQTDSRSRPSPGLAYFSPPLIEIPFAIAGLAICLIHPDSLAVVVDKNLALLILVNGAGEGGRSGAFKCGSSSLNINLP